MERMRCDNAGQDSTTKELQCPDYRIPWLHPPTIRRITDVPWWGPTVGLLPIALFLNMGQPSISAPGSLGGRDGHHYGLQDPPPHFYAGKTEKAP